jgi:hypothetical protein
MLVGGCGENPERAAQKKAEAAVEAAMKEFAAKGDFDKAQKTLKQALAEVSGGGAGQEFVLLVDGSLKYGQANKMQDELTPLWTSMDNNLDELSSIFSQISKTQSEKVQIETSLRSREEEKRQLLAQLEGDANGPGLAAKLKDAQAKLSELKSQKGQLEQKLSEQLKQATELQRQADELLAKAELATGDRKSQLQKQAYDVLLGSGGNAGKNAYLSEAQNLQDEVKTVESEITMVEPQVTMLTEQVDQNRKRIDALDKSDFVASSNQRLVAIGTTLARFQGEFSAILGQIEQTQSQLAGKMKQITDLFLSAQKNFKRITTEESLRDFARVAAAEASLSLAQFESDYALSLRRAAARLTILASGEATDSQAQLKTLAQRYLDESEELVSKALAGYDDASSLYGKIPAKKDEFAIAVLKNNILALAQKAYLAERVENMDAKAKAIEQAKDLINKAVKFDQAFEAVLNEPPYSILGGKTAEGPVEEEPAVPVKAKGPKTAKPNAIPGQNQPSAEPNGPGAEPSRMPSEPNRLDGAQSAKDKAEQLAKLMSEGRFEDATALFDDKMKQALPAAKLEEVWKQLETAGGQFKGFGQARMENIEGFDTVYVPANWENNKLDLKVSIDKQGRVAGFWTVAPQ